MQPKLVRCTINDLVEVAHCHRAAFPDSFATRLGIRYLVKNFEWYLLSKRTFLIKAEVENRVVGYCGGMLIDNASVHGSTSSIMQYTFKQAVLSMLIRPWLLFDKEIRKNVKLIVKNVNLKLKNILKKSSRNTPSKPEHMHKQVSLGLVVIGTLPSFRGKGIGFHLLAQFEIEARKMGAQQMHLSVKRNNREAIKSYTRSGWVVINEGNENAQLIKPLT